MNLKTLHSDVLKLILAGAAFALGTVLGGMVATMLQLPLPIPPERADMSTVGLFSMLTTPLGEHNASVKCVPNRGRLVTAPTWVARTPSAATKIMQDACGFEAYRIENHVI